MKKVLFVATVVKLHINVFHIPFFKWFKENGYEVHVAAKNDYESMEDCHIAYCDRFYDIPFERNPLNLNNLRSISKLKKIIDTNDYDIIHCHTPVGGAIGRLAAIDARKKGAQILYTAHGFHFYEGAPLLNWLLYYPIEKWLSRYTDNLITINKEDYNITIRNNFKMKKVNLINGVGIDLEKFKPQSKMYKSKIRRKNGFSDNDFILIYVGELSYRKNQEMLIKIISKLKFKIPEIKLLLVGTGSLKEYYQNLIDELELFDNIKLLGFRKDITELMSISDLAVSTSRQEGLPVNIMEAMATGLPLVVTKCRGNSDLVHDNKNGYVVNIDDYQNFAESIEKIYRDEELRGQFSINSIKLIKKYSLENIIQEMKNIYTNKKK